MGSTGFGAISVCELHEKQAKSITAEKEINMFFFILNGLKFINGFMKINVARQKYCRREIWMIGCVWEILSFKTNPTLGMVGGIFFPFDLIKTVTSNIDMQTRLIRKHFHF